MRLSIPILINCALVLVVYLADKYTPLKKLPYMAKQIIIGLLFGGVSAFASSFGVEWLGTIVNVRDAAPLSAGLIFGAPAGIISGLMLGFTMSLDDFVISHFVSSPDFQTLPLYVYNQTSHNVKFSMYALCSLIVVVILGILITVNFAGGKKKSKGGGK